MARRSGDLLFILLMLSIHCVMRTRSIEQSGYQFIKSLLDPETGMAGSPEAATVSTVYQNALVAMVLIHEGDIKATEKILSHFQRYQMLHRDDFRGFPQKWNPKTGLADTSSIHWEGDSAFLLLALNYYTAVCPDSNKYQELIKSLIAWLTQRANSCDLIIAEGVADMYAALAPFATNPLTLKSLERLRHCFFSSGQISSLDYEQNLYHIVRGALVFGDTSGFAHLDNFVQSEIRDSIATEKWIGYSIFSGQQPINAEVTTQTLLALKMWQRDTQFNAFHLCQAIEQELVHRQNTSPIFSGSKVDDKSGSASRFSLLAPVCYLLFSCWNFNPFAPQSFSPSKSCPCPAQRDVSRSAGSVLFTIFLLHHILSSEKHRIIWKFKPIAISKFIPVARMTWATYICFLFIINKLIKSI